MMKYRLDIELDIYAEDVGKALFQFRQRLTEVQQTLGKIPTAAFDGVEKDAISTMTGGKHSPGKLDGWLAKITVSVPK